MKKLIINADDFGLSRNTFDWTVKGFERGVLTSATIMAGMPMTAAAVAYAKAHPEFSFGVHLTLVDEKPLSPAGKIPSMVDPSTGMLWPTRQFIIRNFLGLVKVEDLVREMSAQVGALRDLGLSISHFDGHGHNHRLPRSIKALKIVAGKFGVRKTRRTQDLACGKLGFLSRVVNGPMQHRLERAGFETVDHFLMNAGHTADPDWFGAALRVLPEGVTEIGVHPGDDEPWRRIEIGELYSFERGAFQNAGITLASYLSY